MWLPKHNSTSLPKNCDFQTVLDRKFEFGLKIYNLHFYQHIYRLPLSLNTWHGISGKFFNKFDYCSFQVILGNKSGASFVPRGRVKWSSMMTRKEILSSKAKNEAPTIGWWHVTERNCCKILITGPESLPTAACELFVPDRWGCHGLQLCLYFLEESKQTIMLPHINCQSDKMVIFRTAFKTRLKIIGLRHFFDSFGILAQVNWTKYYILQLINNWRYYWMDKKCSFNWHMSLIFRF